MKPPRRDGGRRSRSSRTLEVLYEDDAIVAVNKPAGLASVPVRGSDAPSALSLLSAQLKRQRAFVVHRIDRFTSGILLFAKTEADRDTARPAVPRPYAAPGVSRRRSRSPRLEGGDARAALSKGRDVSKADVSRATRRRRAPNFAIPSSAP